MACDDKTTSAQQELLQALSRTLGRPLTLDSDGRCGLSFEGDTEVLLHAEADDDCLTISTELGVAADAITCRAALTLNYGHLPPTLSIALEPASGQLLLFTRLPLASISEETLVHLLAEFVELRPALRSRLLTPEPTLTGLGPAPGVILRG